MSLILAVLQVHGLIFSGALHQRLLLSNQAKPIEKQCVTPTLNEVYKRTLEEHALADYMAIYLKK